MFKDCSSGVWWNKGKAFDFGQIQLYKMNLSNFWEHHFMCLQKVAVKLLLAKVKHLRFNSPNLGVLTPLEKSCNKIWIVKSGLSPYKNMSFWETWRITLFLQTNLCLYRETTNMLNSTLIHVPFVLIHNSTAQMGLWQYLAVSNKVLAILQFTTSYRFFQSGRH